MLIQDAGKESQVLYLLPCSHVCPKNEWVSSYLPRQEQNTDSDGGKRKSSLNISLQTWQEASAEIYEK